jgi:hypothetical protein
MNRTLSLCFAGLLLLPAQAARRVGEAEVRADANGLPCFTISEREEQRSGTPDFQAITVSDGQRVLWRMAMPRERTFSVSFSMCIPYGGRVPALPQTPAAALDEGKVYTVRVDTRPGRNAVTPLRYQTQFCFKGTTSRNALSSPVSAAGPGQSPRVTGISKCSTSSRTPSLL